MIDQRTGIEPPPSLEQILATQDDRIGRVDFSHRLVPEPAPEAEQAEPAREEPARDQAVGVDAVDQPTVPPAEPPAEVEAQHEAEAHADDAGDETGAEPLSSGPVILPVVGDLADEVEPLLASEPESTEIQPSEGGAVEAEAPIDEATAVADEQTDVVVTDLVAHQDQNEQHHDETVRDERDLDQEEDDDMGDVLELSEPVSALLSLVPAEDAAVVNEDVDDVVSGVIGRIREVRSATIAHLEAIEVESALRCEMLTAQAELDAELIRLHARREAHAIIAAARHRSGLPVRSSADEQRLRELHEAATRLSEELEALGIRPGSSDHPFSR